MCILLCCGCHHWGYFPKRQSELNCPTDIRQTIPWCAGEDAVFRCPCGPSPHFYGHKPTCWGYWPAPGEVWRDSYCGCSVAYAADEELSVPVLAPEPLPASDAVDSANDNRTLTPSQSAAPRAEPLFVPPQLPVSQPPGAVIPRAQGNHFPLKQSAKVPKKRWTPQVPVHSEGIRQVCHTEETKLEPHSWTGVEFIR